METRPSEGNEIKRELDEVELGPDPKVVEVSLSPGTNRTLRKCVQTKEEKGTTSKTPLQLYLLTDATGSMGGYIGQVQTFASTLTNDILAAIPGTEFAAGYYRDKDDDVLFAAQTNFGTVGNTTGVISAIKAWNADGGGDITEGQFYALHEIATNPGVASWEADKAHVLVWFGDAPAHDPMCASEFPGLSVNITEHSVTKELKTQKIIVVAISNPTGGLNAAPSSGYGSCAAPGTAGQASRITNATGGLYLTSTVAGIVDAIVTAVTAVVPPPPITVTPVVTCDSNLRVAFTPSILADVSPGDKPCMTENITAGALFCRCDVSSYSTCSVQFVDQTNSSIGSPQVIKVHATSPDTVAPVLRKTAALCLWSPNHKYFYYDNFLTTNKYFKFHTATDNCGGPVTASFKSCRSTQSANGVGDGNTLQDCVFNASSNTLKVRPERQGTVKGGRYYYVYVDLKDSCGNMLNTMSKIWIPHDAQDFKNSPFKMSDCQKA